MKARPHRIRGALVAAALGLALSGIPSGADAQQENAKGDESKAVVKLADGGQRVLSGPLSISGTFSSPRFTISNPVAGAIESITAMSADAFGIIPRDGAGMLVTASADAEITGVGEWGRESVGFGRIVSVLFVHTVPSPALAAANQWLCELSDGTELSIGWSADWWAQRALQGAVGAISLQLSPKVVRSIQVSDGQCEVRCVGDYVLAGWRASGETLEADCPFGHLKIAWGSIQSLANQGPLGEEAFPAVGYRIVTTDGAEVVLPGLTVGVLRGELSDATAELSLDVIRRIDRPNAGAAVFAVEFVDGVRLNSFQPPENANLSGSSAVGSVRIPWVSAASIARVGEEPPLPNFQATWQVTTGGGLVLPVSELLTGEQASVNGEIEVKKLAWDAVASVKSEPAGLRLQFANGTNWSLSGKLTATTPYGKLSFACTAVAQLARSDSSVASMVDTAPVMARVRTVGGGEYAVASPELLGANRAIGDDDYWGYDLFTVSTPPIELWLGSKALLSYRCEAIAGQVVSDHPAVYSHGPLMGFTGLSFRNAAGEFNVPIAALKEFVPQAQPEGVSAEDSRKYRVRVRKGAQTCEPFEASEIRFARYPKYGWSGYYSVSAYPFQWHRESSLLFKRGDDGSRVDVDFDRLSRIELTGAYTAGRKASITNTGGSTLTGEIYPGDVAESHGVSTWEPAKEGLACKIGPDVYVFVRFKDVSGVEIEHLAQE